MPYYRLFYHIVWATKNREPLITPDVEPIIYNFLRTKAIGLGGTVFAINGMEEHVHMVASIPPKIAVATFVGQAKGVTSAKYNKQYRKRPSFYWQEEYSVFSFGGKRLPFVINYVERQKEHHAEQSIIPALERVSGESKRPLLLQEPRTAYLVGQDTWHKEMLELA
ncbi:MAG: IS200/IS605 family transposase [Chloroflexi bacterium]|nr:IS200/IS605 family transposase [Chloroflexota bacterium]